jgi:predicted Zn-dependent protease
MMASLIRRTLPLLACVTALSLGACSTNPATGEQSFTAFMSPADEKRVGAEQHPQILEEFGGAYDDPQLGAYVASLGARLAAVSERPDLNFTFTILDSPVVNAFALPGGYVYVSRGLLALADNEAELAGVIGHEIGHVTARHSAERYSRSVVVNLGAGILGAVTGQRAVADLANLGGGLYLKSYSRENEFEADSLGLRYMTALGYEPSAVSQFLASLAAQSELEARLKGADRNPNDFNLLSTHPRTLDRVREAQQATGTLAPGQVERDGYLRRIDGMLYGDNPDEGFIRDRTFIHPTLRFRFVAPPGFTLINGSDRVEGRRGNEMAMIFDGVRDTTGAPMSQYLSSGKWAKGVRLSGVESFTVNGMDAATAAATVQTQQGTMGYRLVAIRANASRIYRFIFLGSPNTLAANEEEMRRTTYSFEILSEGEAASYRPLRLRVVQVQPGDTVDSLAARMPEGPEQRARFLVLNGIASSAPLQPGMLVKIVTE